MLENPRSPRVRNVAQLAKKNVRAQTGLFLVEGPQAVGEALKYRAECVQELYATPTALERHPAIAHTSSDRGVEVEFVTEDVLLAMADTVTPQGFVAVARQFPVSVRDIFASKPQLIVVLEEVRDPGNVGTILRTADAAGADAVILTGRTVDLYNPKVVRSTVGSLFHIPVAVNAQLEDVIQRSRQVGLTVFAADMAGDDILSLRRSGDLTHAAAWVFGNEAHGLSADAVNRADRVVSVPIYGKAESLNLAVAASLCLYQSAFALHASAASGSDTSF